MFTHTSQQMWCDIYVVEREHTTPHASSSYDDYIYYFYANYMI
jgi:hypothetical protein